MAERFTKDIDRGCFLVYKLDKIISGMLRRGKLPLKNN